MLKGIRGRLLLQIGMVLLTIVLLLEAIFATAVYTYYFDSARQIVQSRAVTAAKLSNQFMEGYTLPERARYILENLVPGESSRVEVLDLQGRTVVDSYGFSSSRPIRTADVRAAQQGGIGSYAGYSDAFKQRIMAVSSPLVSYGEVIGTLRFSVSTEPLYLEVAKLIGWSIGIGAAVLLLGFALSLIIARRIVGPVKELTAISHKMATGDFTARVVRKYNDEVGTLAESLNHMNEELSKSEKMKNDFISTVSHELRTPLTSIKGWGETLIVGGLEDEETAMLGLGVISIETDRLIGLVEDLLDFSKYQAGEIRMRSVPVDLSSLLRQLDLQYSLSGNKRGVKLRTQLPAGPLPMHADLNRLKQVFVNLLDNAIKFSDLSGEIRLIAASENLEVHVSVQDDGEGIPAEDLEKIGLRFYKGSSKMSGSGLGLAISKEIVRLHGGRIKIESEYGVGTTVTVTLPLAVEDPAEQPDSPGQNTVLDM
ncbi:ATP-binding protein [Saccharibacillus sp. CPCC 101409]|uniref:sensor histidine kinase n=1 Tax=Saccharibacillus sp. CPCC 101409 TaxID=3058041 RepID=UPI0026714AB4|nr:ATP-binding protein [Saccharibacillus sp. CPCC 101409]MDO3413018.1 ATP-binding protein [Saccharibacillus sp. CPCC 101409]